MSNSRRRRRVTVEQRGIEHIPHEERHGRTWHLGAMWSGLVLNVLTVVYGTILVQLGLNWWQALLAIVLGSLSWIVTGVVSLAGPAAGTTTFGTSQLVFGRFGVRPVAFFNWIMMIGYEVLDLVVMVLAADQLLRMAGVTVTTSVKFVLVVVLSVLQAVLPLLGHYAVTRVLRILVVPFAAIFVIMAFLVADKIHLGHQGPAPIAVVLSGIALVASSSGSGWAPTAADYSRYLPRSTSRSRLVAAVALGGALPSIVLMALGVAIALAMPTATDPVSGLSTVFPTWLVVIYLVLVIVQMVSLNAADLYSSGVTLQACGVRLRRWQAVMVDGVLCGLIGLAVVFANDFYTFVSDFLLFMIVWFAPWSAIFIVDMWRRRGRYPDAAIAGGRSWSVPALAAQAVGMIASLLCINTTVFTGSVSALLSDADLSLISGMVVGGVVYALLAPRDLLAQATSMPPIDAGSSR